MSASGPGDRIASARDIAIYFREDCRTLRDSLQLEMVVAQYVLQIRDVVSSTGVPVGEAAGAGIIAELEGFGDPLSHAILRGVAHLGQGGTAIRGADAAQRLAERGIELPRQFAEVGEARPTGAWRTSEGAFEGEFVLFAEFEYPSGMPHTVMLFVEPRDGGVVKHIGLVGPMAELDRDGPFDPRVMEPVEIADAGYLLHDLLERSYGPQAARSDDFHVLMAAARADSIPF